MAVADAAQHLGREIGDRAAEGLGALAGLEHALLRQAEVGHDEAWEDAERDCARSLERSPTAKAFVGSWCDPRR